MPTPSVSSTGAANIETNADVCVGPGGTEITSALTVNSTGVVDPGNSAEATRLKTSPTE